MRDLLREFVFSTSIQFSITYLLHFLPLESALSLLFLLFESMALIFKNCKSCYFAQNRAKSGNLGKIARFAIRAKPGIVLIEFVLSGDLL